MSPEIVWEARFVLESLCLGMILHGAYDLIRIVRRVFPHGKAAVGTEDFLYWMFHTCLVFRLLFKYNYGVIRWFAIAGVFLGMLLYHGALGDRLVQPSARYLRWLVTQIEKPFRKLKKIHKKVDEKGLKKEQNDSRVEGNKERRGLFGVSKKKKRP